MYKRLKDVYAGKGQYYIDSVSTLHATNGISRENCHSYTKYVITRRRHHPPDDC
jgi:hypothetical protein